MRNPLFLFLFLCHSLILDAQDPAYGMVSPNNVTAGIHANGSMFMSEDGNQLGYFAPLGVGSEVGTIFSAGIWMTATDDAGNLKVNSTTYGGQINNNKYYSPGPTNAASINFDFNKVFKVSGLDIKKHIADFADGQIDDPIAMSLWDWPGAGNALYGLPTNQLLAPFFDEDGDGIYNPQNGDYPVVAIGDASVNLLVPDEMIYTIVNDNSPSFNNPLGVELHTLLFGFNCTNDPLMQNTLFARHTIINNSTSNLNNLKFSLWMDPDLGCFTDDLMGCDSTRNAFYVYNEDAVDGEVGGSCPAGVNTYFTLPPVQSIVLLNQKMENFHYYANCGFGDPPPAACDPSTNVEYANAMNSIWRDGTSLTVGGDGYNLGSLETTKYAFHDDPNDSAGWSMHAAGLGQQDRRILASCGKTTLSPGEVMNIDYAYVFTRRAGLDNLEQVTAAFEDIDQIQSYYDTQLTNTCVGISSSKDLSIPDNIKLHPNPASQNIHLSQAHDFKAYHLIDELGRSVKKGDINNGESQIDLENMQGIYFLILTNASERITKKIVAL